MPAPSKALERALTLNVYPGHLCGKRPYFSFKQACGISTLRHAAEFCVYDKHREHRGKKTTVFNPRTHDEANVAHTARGRLCILLDLTADARQPTVAIAVAIVFPGVVHDDSQRGWFSARYGGSETLRLIVAARAESFGSNAPTRR